MSEQRYEQKYEQTRQFIQKEKAHENDKTAIKLSHFKYDNRKGTPKIPHFVRSNP